MKKQKQDAAEMLKGFLAKLNERHEFKPGDLVQWKPGLQNKCRGSETTFIVMEVLPEPIFDPSENNAGHVYFREPLDIILGTIVTRADNGEKGFGCFHCDSRRFEPVNQ